MLEGYASVGDVKSLFVGYKLLLQRDLGNTIDVGKVLNGEVKPHQHTELIIFFSEMRIGLPQSLREAITCCVEERRYLLPVLRGKGDVFTTLVLFFNPFVEIILFHYHLPHHGKLGILVCQVAVILLVCELFAAEGKDGVGIFPASVNNTADLHSMGQFIQEGDRVMFETVVHVEKATRSVVIGSDPQNLDQLNYLAGKHVEHCGQMAELGTVIAHQDGGVPQLQIAVEKVDAFNLGSLFYFFEFACGVSAYTLGVNPFNQPGVEAYKKNMFALLETYKKNMFALLEKPGFEEATKAIKARL